MIASTEPTGAQPAWASTNVRPYSEGAEEPGSPDGNALFGASCPSEELCVLVGARGAILTSTEPFATTVAPKSGGSAKGKATGKRVRGPKRPRVRIANLHFLTTLGGKPYTGPRRVRMTVRFYARGPVRRFECRLDQRGFRPCRSPKRYAAIGRGIHSVSIRAVGRTGLRGRVAHERFYVGRVCRPRECVGGAGPLPGGTGWRFDG